ncbi:hypothetical protein OSK38_25745 [Escherichia coli]|nr:hypothetical protein [Escherichia coli]
MSFTSGKIYLSLFCFSGRGEEMETEPQVVVPVEIREMTRVETEKGNIHVIHEITLGDLLVSMSLVALLIFQVLSRVIRR